MNSRTLALSSALVLVLAACASEGGSSTTAGDVTTTARDVTTTAGAVTTTRGDATTTTAGAGGEGGIHASETDLGTILVDDQGFTLYAFANDTDGESTCYDSCAENWPAVPGDSEIGGDLDAALFATTARTDGTEQLTVSGQPLYRFTPDAAPGDVGGQGVGGVWFVVGTDGAMIGGPEASADVVPTEDDLDY
jgi:predicted lipoprotein with Yx(FWY)xxD motif